jgi:hypothetical protein
VRGVAITLDDSADGAAFQVLFEIKGDASELHDDASGKNAGIIGFIGRP